ncbi:MAG: hypothetical protein IPJ65_28145 [Archangiaceae bacterium]|nr:hypothetical protein [Archangiaceae bacterium]
MNTKTVGLLLGGLMLSCQGEAPAYDDATSIDDALAAGAPRVVRAASTHKVLLDAAGYNPRFDHDEAPWSTARPDFAAALRESGARIIRYPGGTFANSWDYDADRFFPAKRSGAHTGWVNPARIELERVAGWISEDSRPRYGVDDLARVAAGPHGANVVFHMNMVTPGQDFYESPDGLGHALDGSVGSADWYRMLDDRYARFKRMLVRAQNKGIAVRFIELGNEYYFDLSYARDAFPTGRAHGLAANYLAGKLKRDFGTDLKIAATASCVPGTDADPRMKSWNQTLFDVLDHDQVTHVTMHAYKALESPDQYSETSFQRALAGWVDATESRFQRSGASDTFLAHERGWRVWYTETNANWDGTLDPGEGTPATETKWGQSLAEAYSTVHLYDLGNATLLLQFNFTGTVRKHLGDDGSWLLNRARVLQPFMRATAGATGATVLDIPARNIEGTDRSLVQGLCFEGDRTRCYVVNLGSKPVKLDLSAFFPHASTLQVEGYRNDLNSIEVPLTVSRTAPTDATVVPGYASVELERP